MRLTIHDPTDPARWPTQRERGRIAFQLLYGVLALGLPIAIVFDVALLLVRHDGALFFSPHHVLRLLLITFTIAPTTGLLLGRMLWRLGEQRYGDTLLTAEFYGDDRDR